MHARSTFFWFWFWYWFLFLFLFFSIYSWTGIQWMNLLGEVVVFFLIRTRTGRAILEIRESGIKKTGKNVMKLQGVFFFFPTWGVQEHWIENVENVEWMNGGYFSISFCSKILYQVYHFRIFEVGIQYVYSIITSYCGIVRARMKRPSTLSRTYIASWNRNGWVIDGARTQVLQASECIFIHGR